MVQIITTPPMDAARATRTIRVVLVVEVAPLVAGAALGEPVSEEVMVWITVGWPWEERVGVNEGSLFAWVGVEGGWVAVEEVEDDEGLEEDELELEAGVWESDEVEETEEEDECEDGSGELEVVEDELETGGTEPMRLPPWLGSLLSPSVPGLMMSEVEALPRTSGNRLRSILWPSSWAFADAPSVKTSTRAREQKKVRTSFLDLTLNIPAKMGIF
jgi:hypothetical protein